MGVRDNESSGAIKQLACDVGGGFPDLFGVVQRQIGLRQASASDRKTLISP
jgi:hypothetical protein